MSGWWYSGSNRLGDIRPVDLLSSTRGQARQRTEKDVKRELSEGLGDGRQGDCLSSDEDLRSDPECTTFEVGVPRHVFALLGLHLFIRTVGMTRTPPSPPRCEAGG